MNPRIALILILLSLLLFFPLHTSLVSAQPALLVQKTWGGSSNDYGQGVAVDAFNNIYVTGYTHSFGPGAPLQSALTLLKYTSAESLLWQRIWSGSGNGSDVGSGVAVDASGNVYATGYTTSFDAGGRELLLLRFNSTGSLLWQKTWGGSGADSGSGVAVDSFGNIYVAGSSLGAVALLKFDSHGSLLWQRTWGTAETGQGVAVDSSGNIYVTGYTHSFGAGGYDLLLLKFNSTGALVWQRTWGGVFSDYGSGVAVDSSDHIYVTGQTDSFGAGALDALLLKFNSTGALVWQRTWGGINLDVGSSVAVDGSSKIYVAGSTYSFGAGDGDVVLLLFDSYGSLQLQRTWGGSSTDFSSGVAVDSSGSVVVTGSVGEAPPYTFGSTGNNSLGTPSFSLGVPSYTLGTPTFTTRTPPGTARTPTGSQIYAGGLDEFLFKYGDKAALTFKTNPAAGSINFSGTVYSNGQGGNYTFGNFTASARPPAGYSFSGWSSTGGITIANTTVSPTTATVSGPGTLTANFTFVSPLNPPTILLAALTAPILLALKRRRIQTGVND